MDLRQLVMLGFQVSILATVFGFGLKATPADFRYLLERPGLLLRSLLAMLVITPVVAVVLARTFDFQPAAEIALIALAISPVPPLLPKKEHKAGGHHSYGLALMAFLATLAIATVPLSVKILTLVSGRPLNADPAAIGRVVVIATVLPLMAGVAVRRLLPAVAARIAPIVARVARVLIPLTVVALLAGTWRLILAAIGGGAIVAMIVFVGVALLIGDLLGGPDRNHSVVLALSNASRHPAIALSIASANFPNQHFVGTILLYLIVNTVVAVAYMKWRRPAVSAVVVTP